MNSVYVDLHGLKHSWMKTHVVWTLFVIYATSMACVRVERLDYFCKHLKQVLPI